MRLQMEDRLKDPNEIGYMGLKQNDLIQLNNAVWSVAQIYIYSLDDIVYFWNLQLLRCRD